MKIAGAREYIKSHPIYAFYRHLWSEDRILFAKVASVAFLHGLDLFYSVPILYVFQEIKFFFFFMSAFFRPQGNGLLRSM